MSWFFIRKTTSALPCQPLYLYSLPLAVWIKYHCSHLTPALRQGSRPHAGSPTQEHCFSSCLLYPQCFPFPWITHIGCYFSTHKEHQKKKDLKVLQWASLVAQVLIHLQCRRPALGLIPGLGRSPGEGKGYLLQHSGLENSTDCIVHGVAKSRTRLNDFH